MTLVRASIDIDAPRERVYDFVLDPGHLDQWVTVHRRINSRDAGPPREGYEMDQTLHLRGANFKVHWTLTEADRPYRATWEGRGPAHSHARTAYTLHDLNVRLATWPDGELVILDRTLEPIDFEEVDV